MSQRYSVPGEQIIGEIIHEFTHRNTPFVVIEASYDDYSNYWVGHKRDIQKEEDSYWYKMRQEHEDKLNKIKENIEKEKEKLADKAINSIVARMKLNSIFSDDDKMTQVGLAVAKELKKLVKEEVKKI